MSAARSGGGTIAFAPIRARAERRKGGAKALRALLPPASGAARLAQLGDDRVLAEMTRRVFCAGFSWRVIEAKWPSFEEAFLGFQPATLAAKPDAFWNKLKSDARIVRNNAKIQSVRGNARFVRDIAEEHGSFGSFLADWPSSDQAGLLGVLARRGNRLGGNTGQMLLRFLGWDGFVLSADVVACLRDAGLDIAAEVKSKGDLARVQEQFNAWAAETGLPYTHLSRICAMSIGENQPAEDMESGQSEG
ncbi:MAG: DNA-3-methyladenine glycosylase I [Nevskia sp.]|nr:DNA-3-methyladenine glycosylase I [Nevskia sp.]